MSRFKSSIKKLLTAQRRFAVWWVTYVPPFLVLIALIWLIFTSLHTLKDDNLNRQIVIFYLSGIGISISLASASFSYARVSDEPYKQKIISGGEHFFYAAILLITALLINWLIVEGHNFFDRHETLKHVNLIFSLFVGFSYFFATYAAQSIVSGIWKLDKVLFEKTLY